MTRFRFTAVVLLIVSGVASAQTKAPQQVVKPPVAQLWMDVATHTMAGMPEMPGMGGMGAMGGLLGGGARDGGNAFGNTRTMSAGRWVDIALYTQRKPGGTEGKQAVPTGTGLAPSLALVPPRSQPTAPGRDGETYQHEQPKGRILFYWGCGETVRPGQPRVLDFSKSNPQEWGNFMQGRATRERGALARPGNALWPNEKDRRQFGRDASLVGEHAVTGDGVPDGLRFAIGQVHDFMPAIALTQGGSTADAIRLRWQPVTQARGYFLNAMSAGGPGGAGGEMVFWSSSELPDFGMGLLEYASPANVDAWIKEKVVLPAATTECVVPKGIFAKADAAMLRMIAYGPELNLAHPPRPTDVNIPWEPDWAVRVRTKATAMAMLGMDMGGAAAAEPARSGAATPTTAGAQPRPDCPPPASAQGGDTAADAGAAVGGALGGSLGRAVGGLLGGLGGKKPEPKPEVPADCPK